MLLEGGALEVLTYVLLGEEQPGFSHGSHIELFDIDHQWEIVDDISEQEASSCGGSSDQRANRLAV